MTIMLAALFISYLVLAASSLPVEVDKSLQEPDTNAEWLGGGFEGDMLLPPGFDPHSTSRGVGILGAVRRWPGNTIPYDISAISNSKDRETITAAMEVLMYAVRTPVPNHATRKACVSFRPAQSTDQKVLKIQYGTGCSATVGYNTQQVKTLNLKSVNCFHSGIIQHELTHVLGFFHEQSRPDRDSYITVNHANIIETSRSNFDKYAWGSDVENQNLPSDYGSIMHYGASFFTSNSKPTITPKQAGVTIGQREKLSPIDIAEIRHYYKC